MVPFALPTLFLLPFFQPRLDKRDLGPLRFSNGPRREIRRRLVRKQAVLVPVVHTLIDKNKRLGDGAGPPWKPNAMRRGVPPRVSLAVNAGQPGVPDVDAPVLVDALDLRRGGDVEGLTADDRGVVQVDEAGDERELVGRDT